jgi:hypothetical protein
MPAYLLVMEGEEAQRRGRYADIPAQGLGFQVATETTKIAKERALNKLEVIRWRPR